MWKICVSSIFFRTNRDASKTLAVFAMKCSFLDICVSPGCHSVNIVRIQSFSGQLFSRIWAEYGDLQSSQSEYGEIRTRKTPNKDTFHLVYAFDQNLLLFFRTLTNSWKLLRNWLKIFPFWHTNHKKLFHW